MAWVLFLILVWYSIEYIEWMFTILLCVQLFPGFFIFITLKSNPSYIYFCADFFLKMKLILWCLVQRRNGDNQKLFIWLWTFFEFVFDQYLVSNCAVTLIKPQRSCLHTILKINVIIAQPGLPSAFSLFKGGKSAF